jgi:hypothetical protein
MLTLGNWCSSDGIPIAIRLRNQQKYYHTCHRQLNRKSQPPKSSSSLSIDRNWLSYIVFARTVQESLALLPVAFLVVHDSTGCWQRREVDQRFPSAKCIAPRDLKIGVVLGI